MADDNEFTDRQCQQGKGRAGFVIPQMEFKVKCLLLATLMIFVIFWG